MRPFPDRTVDVLDLFSAQTILGAANVDSAVISTRRGQRFTLWLGAVTSGGAVNFQVIATYYSKPRGQGISTTEVIATILAAGTPGPYTPTNLNNHLHQSMKITLDGQAGNAADTAIADVDLLIF